MTGRTYIEDDKRTLINFAHVKEVVLRPCRGRAGNLAIVQYEDGHTFVGGEAADQIYADFQMYLTKRELP